MSLLSWREKHAPEIIGDNPLLKDVLQITERAAETDCTVLITGESGTGKDLLARAIHRASDRARGPYIPLNCGAIPESLLESELFGHVRGAFTGAVNSRIGRFAAAEGGTLFLDEIGEMSIHLQAKLLRVLQEKEFSPVGDSKTYTCDVRIVAATNCDLEQRVADGEFRDDLFWRLNVVTVELPPLKSRMDDLKQLCQHFIDRYNERYNRQLEGISENAYEMMCNYAWPGNIRQLENAVQRAVVVKGSGILDLQDLPPQVHSSAGARSNSLSYSQLPEEGLDLRQTLESLENALIMQALERTSWNKNQAASLLQLNRTTLVEKLKKKGLSLGKTVAA